MPTKVKSAGKSQRYGRVFTAFFLQVRSLMFKDTCMPACQRQAIEWPLLPRQSWDTLNNASSPLLRISMRKMREKVQQGDGGVHVSRQVRSSHQMNHADTALSHASFHLAVILSFTTQSQAPATSVP